jgi:neutral ceramidase
MPTRICRCMKTGFARTLIFLTFAAGARAELRAGAAKVGINPPTGAAMAGYYNFRACDGVLDDIHAHALVLDDGATRAALVTLDLIGSPRDLVEAVRAEVQKSGLIPGAHVMISATHAHTGPVPGRLVRTPDSPESLPADSPHNKYLAQLPALIAASVAQAAENLAPAAVSGVSGECTDVTFCRRFYMRDGTVGWNPGKLNPDIMLPTATTDPQVQAVFFEPAHAHAAHVPAFAIYANFSMHPDTVGGTKASADYPGALGRILSGYHGKDCITLYGNGTCGNLNHLDVNWPRAQKGPEEAHRLGTLLAAAIFRAEKNQRALTPGALRVKSVTVPLDVPFVSQEQEELARYTVRKKESGPQPSFMQLVHANRLLDLAPRQGKPVEAEVQVITLGKEVAWIALPGEVFVELGIALKKRSPFPHTIITTLANGNEGYIPDRRSYAEKAYEAESARVEPGSGEKLVDAAAAILTELHAAN